jgi:predicted ArsR family transcriptional regulator
MYEEGRQYAAIKKFMDDKGEIFSCSAIRNHMQEHYRNQERMAALVEYCDNLAGMMERRKSRRDDLECLINIGYIELARVLTIPTNGDIGREKERSEMIQRTKKSILDVIGMMNEMENADAQVEAVKRKVIDAWASRIENAKNDAEKQAFIAALKEFRNLI